LRVLAAFYFVDFLAICILICSSLAEAVS